MKDLTGISFSRLQVTAFSHRLLSGKSYRYFWHCKCECGNTRIVNASGLKNGTTRSCGCLATETKIKQLKTHGMRGTKEHRAWINMRRRCNDPNNDSYKYYGARGISVCLEWNNSFEAFYNYVGPAPGSDYSIDRKNNDRGYEPGNVKWSTKSEQSKNRRKFHAYL